ncbi:hypothetical protein BS47DRAFT_240260 [Hydnum rufescens UP504]|uniref:S-methyl-5'-thioadenosine phosphorylase n=1 Tax=Hydnum rufescens UP504 TaxID=1448309 RepID=A0A9P6DS47_9AGAM|nr:hypothetical protein BS47DRAFT_240260 [Hydnum rufescens UP504]
MSSCYYSYPWGYPSSPITIASLPNGAQVAFLARHGVAHSVNPSAVPARANIAALSSIGVKAIIAFSAVGSLREEIAPGDFVIPSQIIDRTKGIRPASFFDGTSVVAHAMFGDPFDTQLVNFITPLIKEALASEKRQLHLDKTVVCMEGPQFSTRAESLMYRAWGGDIINMSVIPEAKLAREAELRWDLFPSPRYVFDVVRCSISFTSPSSLASYALIATSTDYDAWRVGEDPVTVSEVFKTLQDNAATSRRVAAAIIEHVHDIVEKDTVLTNVIGSMRFSIVTPQERQSEEDRKKLSFILPYFK